MRMEYQLPPPAAILQLGGNNSNSNNPLTQLNVLQTQQQQQQHQTHLQILQNVQHHHQQQQQQQHQQNANHQQHLSTTNTHQQQQLLGSMQPPPPSTTTTTTSTLPPLSSLPLQVVHNLPHLLSGGGGVGVGGNNNGLNTSNILNNNLLSSNNSNTGVVNNNNNLTATNNTINNVNLLRNTMHNVANSQLQQTINNLGNNLNSLPPSSQLLHHHLQHLANVNNAAAAVVAVAANNLNNNNNNNNNIVNNLATNNNNNNPATPNNNLTLNNNENHPDNNNNTININMNSLVGVLSNGSNGGDNHNNNNSNNSSNGGNGNNTATTPTVNVDEQNRWTQFQVQQLWKQHASYLNGKSTSNSKEVICGDDKYKEEGDLWNVEAQTAFLGPNLWDKTLPYDADLKYADLDEFLSENNIPDGLPGSHLGHSSGLGHRSDPLGHAAGLSLSLSHITTKRERSPSPSGCISPDTLNPPSPAESTFSFASSGRDFDPRTRAFSDEELKPQPMIKKSRKQFVPDELKDDKYWARRRKNNIAAKRSRDARRQKENQIAMRARYLEKENATLHQEVEQLKQENMDLRARLSKFQDV